MAYNIFERWPFTSFQNLNLDWLLKTTKEAADRAEDAAETVEGYNDRLATVENDNIELGRQIMNIQTLDNTQNTRIETLETDVETHEQDIRSLNGWNQEQETNIQALAQAGYQRDAKISALESADANNVKVTAQDFDATDKNIARNNIGAGTSTVTYDRDMNAIIIEDVLTGELETVPVSEGGGGNPNAVLYVLQSLTEAQKTQARQNISAGRSTVTYDPSNGILTIIDAESGTPTAYLVPSDTVRYVAQSLTTAQQQQARANIGAGSTTTRVNASDGTITITDPTFASGNPMTYQYRTVFLIVAVYSNGEYTFNRNQADILSAIERGQLPVVRYHTTAGQSDYDVYYEWVFNYYTYDGEDVYIFFDRIDQYGNVSQMKWYASTGKAVVTESATVPKATSADDGKIPMVNSFGNYQLILPAEHFVTPEMYGAAGNGVTDDTDAIEQALNSGKPVYCNNQYLVTRMVTISDKQDVVIHGGTFIVNTNGEDDFIYVLRCRSLYISNVRAINTDGQNVYGNNGGTFVRTNRTPVVFINDCYGENLNMFYRANYTMTNDSNQYFMDSINIDGLTVKNCICPIEAGYCKSVTIENVTAFSSGVQRELVYIVGGIENLACSGIWCQASSRFAFHFNNNGGSATPNNSLRQNWVKHFALSDSTFLACGASSVVDPMSPVGTITITNVYGGDHIFRSHASPNDSCQCEKMIISNSDIVSPYIDGGNTGGGKFGEVMFDNCVIHGILELHSDANPVNLEISNCKMVFNTRPNLGCITFHGNASIKDCLLESDVDNTVAQHVIYMFGADSSLNLINTDIEFIGVNRFIFNISAKQRINALYNRARVVTYGNFTQSTPTSCTIIGNTVNLLPIADVNNKIAATGISLSDSTKSITVGETFVLTPTLTPADSDYKDFIFNNPSTSIVSVTKTVINGKYALEVKGLAAGTATITVRVRDLTTINTTCQVTVS